MDHQLKLVTVVGTRPELIRLSLIIEKCDQCFDHILVHTGQNYDYELNEIFFEDLSIRKPDFFLNVSENNLGRTIGNIISASYELFDKIKPNALLVLGDTNSSLCIISAKRLKIPIFHMEAGNRCFDQNVPEEINRKIVDHISDINLCYTENSRKYLISEGFRKDHVFVVGSPLYEVLSHFQQKINKSQILNNFKIKSKKYIVASLHREENLDLKENFINIIKVFNKIANRHKLPVYFTTHPRTKNKLEKLNISSKELIKFIKPIGFTDYVALQKNAFFTLSDSGTIFEESAMMKFPAISVRSATERPEASESGTIVIGNINEKSLMQSVDILLKTYDPNLMEIPKEYSIKNVSTRIIRLIQGYTEIINREVWHK
tara:strand:- start:761 stop:1885 length:1125 start_codon:yes stop_codon:yes gene_type:complete